MLGVSVLLVSGLAFVIFGAPFYPPLRPLAVQLIFFLSILGTVLIFLLSVIAILIKKYSPRW
jgi:hypothetical protein